MIERAIREQVAATLREELPTALSEALAAMPSAGPGLVTREACARALSISVRSLDTLRAQGLPTVWVLESPRFDVAAVITWLRGRE